MNNITILFFIILFCEMLKMQFSILCEYLKNESRDIPLRVVRKCLQNIKDNLNFINVIQNEFTTVIIITVICLEFSLGKIILFNYEMKDTLKFCIEMFNISILFLCLSYPYYLSTLSRNEMDICAILYNRYFQCDSEEDIIMIYNMMNDYQTSELYFNYLGCFPITRLFILKMLAYFSTQAVAFKGIYEMFHIKNT
ncbi:uncharacterized protein [Centruroides vittatus]|uniref:uncharacterized protein n=1 Tax=Centruroides vittatus TaxID=120091 RepID=UPI00350F967B